MGSNIKITGPGLKGIADAVRLLAANEILVGFPEETTARDPEPGEPLGITNASLGFLHDQGAPEQGIPARPFMIPGIERAQAKVGATLEQVAKKALQPNSTLVVEQGMHRAGLIAQLAIQKTINDGIAPPLAESTLRARARKGRKGAQTELENRAQGLPPSTATAKPLIDTGQLRNAVKYVIRAKRRR